MTSRIATRILLLAGIAGPVIFVATFLVDGATRANYDPVRNYVSLLSLGDRGWVQMADFIVSGVLVAAFGLGLRRVWGSSGAGRWIAWIVIAVGLALIWSGLFATDPDQGYPPNEQGPVPGAIQWIPSHPSWHALLHFMGSVVVFVGLGTAGFLTARRGTRLRGLAARAWTICSLITAAIVIGGWLSGFLAHGNSGVPGTAGLLQRISIVAAMQWLVVTAAIELRSPPAAPAVAGG